jgi:hypothetical protein
MFDTLYLIMSCHNKRKLGHRRGLARPDRSIAFRMEVKDQSHGVLGMSLEFRSFQLSELQFRHYLEMILHR